MKLEVREDARVALGLMERVLSPDAALAPEYPLVFSPGATGRVVVAEEAGEVCSACAILRRDLVFPDELGVPQRLTVGLIGSVSTGEEYRGRGLASSVLSYAEQLLLEDGCLFSLLWADSPDFYDTRGYQPIGLEFDFILDASLCEKLPMAASARGATEADHHGLHKLYSEHARRVARSEFDSGALYSTPGMSTIVVERNGVPVAYACRGRGHDLAGVIHEWAGEPEAVLACIRAQLESAGREGHEGPLFLLCCAGEASVPSRLEELGACFATGVLGMGKILNAEAAAGVLLHASEQAVDLRMESSDSATLTLGPRMAEIAGQEWLDLLLPARGNRDAIEGLERRLQTRFPSLPWTPFLWGLDSI